MYRKTYAEIDDCALKENISKIRAYYPEYEYCFGVVKGNAYGHGMQAVNALIAGGVNYLAVATLEEALKVRIYNREIPILCLEPIDMEYLSIAKENDVTITIHRLDYLEGAIQSRVDGLKIHLKVDSGMNRLGFKSKDDLTKAVKMINECENLMLEGIYTHLATSGLNDAWYDRQIESFKAITSDIDLTKIPIVHIDRSLTLVHHKKVDFVNGMRLGICMYGFAQSIPAPTGLAKIKRALKLRKNPISEPIFENSLKLKTAMKLYSEIIDVKRVKKGEFVGYGADYIAESDMNVATVAIGYYDGVKENFGNVFCKGEKCPILGKICMDMTSVKVSDNIKCGDKVEIFGENLTIHALTRRSGISAYHLLTGISARVPRIMNGKEFEL